MPAPPDDIVPPVHTIHTPAQLTLGLLPGPLRLAATPRALSLLCHGRTDKSEHQGVEDDGRLVRCSLLMISDPS